MTILRAAADTGLRSLSDAQKKVSADEKRSGAGCALLASGTQLISASYRYAGGPSRPESRLSAASAEMFLWHEAMRSDVSRKSSVAPSRASMSPALLLEEERPKRGSSSTVRVRPQSPGEQAESSSSYSSMFEGFDAGEHVTLYDEGTEAWFDATVEWYAEDAVVESATCTHPPGSLKVTSTFGMQWLSPDQVAKRIRKVTDVLDASHKSISVTLGRRQSLMKMAATSTTTTDGNIDLEEAFQLHVLNLTQDDREGIDLEELLTLLDRCKLLGDNLEMRERVRAYYTTIRAGCNHIVGPQHRLGPGGFNCKDFVKLLLWLADITGAPYEKLSAKVIHLSANLCDKSSPMRRKLQVVFETYAQADCMLMSQIEFSTLCAKLQVFRPGLFCVGDVHLLFLESAGFGACDAALDYMPSVDFEEFLRMLSRVGTALKIGSKILHVAAAHADTLEADEASLASLRSNLRHGALVQGDRDWKQFFREQDVDGSGNLSWPEFLHMCRLTLQLTEHDNILRTFFSRVDADMSGEISIEELIEFLGIDVETVLPAARLKAKKYDAMYSIDTRNCTWGTLRPEALAGSER